MMKKVKIVGFVLLLILILLPNVSYAYSPKVILIPPKIVKVYVNDTFVECFTSTPLISSKPFKLTNDELIYYHNGEYYMVIVSKTENLLVNFVKQMENNKSVLVFGCMECYTITYYGYKVIYQSFGITNMIKFSCFVSGCLKFYPEYSFILGYSTPFIPVLSVNGTEVPYTPSFYNLTTSNVYLYGIKLNVTKYPVCSFQFYFMLLNGTLYYFIVGKSYALVNGENVTGMGHLSINNTEANIELVISLPNKQKMSYDFTLTNNQTSPTLCTTTNVVRIINNTTLLIYVSLSVVLTYFFYCFFIKKKLLIITNLIPVFLIGSSISSTPIATSSIFSLLLDIKRLEFLTYHYFLLPIPNSFEYLILLLSFMIGLIVTVYLINTISGTNFSAFSSSLILSELFITVTTEIITILLGLFQILAEIEIELTVVSVLLGYYFLLLAILMIKESVGIITSTFSTKPFLLYSVSVSFFILLQSVLTYVLNINLPTLSQLYWWVSPINIQNVFYFAFYVTISMFVTDMILILIMTGTGISLLS